MKKDPLQNEQPPPQHGWHDIRKTLSSLSLYSLFAVTLLVGWSSTASASESRYLAQGKASWYGPGFDGKRTASGELFDQDELTAAHRRLPLGTLLKVTNVRNGRSVVVRVNDRGPYVGKRIIDLSKGAAKALGMLGRGTTQVRLEAMPQMQSSAN